ncbi:unnamed protein product [Cylindrotheca closterium]|uniref:Hydroxylysine kinase n=1 Tax=Cylindrotheca closterium TaxID=2856 RepID=A0AAD2CSW9_9STRA|nr:unnamed protein product [Cylindrotheca closterium]
MSAKDEPSDEEMRKLLLPNPSDDQLIAAVQKSFAKPGQKVSIVKKLESYDDKNFWVDIDGTYYLAKCHNGVESRDFIKLWKEESAHEKSVIHMQTTIMKHLNENGVTTSNPLSPILDTELPIPASIHEMPVHSESHSPCELVLRLFSWVPGRTMNSVKMLPLEALVDAGRYLGKLSVALSSIDTSKLAACKRYHQWDGKNTKDLKDFVQYVDDPTRKSMVESVIAAFEEQLIDSKDSEKLPVGLIHSDFNDANMLLDENCCVSGVIDFGDTVESWKVLDLSVAMAYAMLTSYGNMNRGISAAAAFLRGYSSVCTLTAEERQHLVLLIACRLSCSVTLGAYSYKQSPENDYLLLHAKPGWDALGTIWGTDVEKRKEMRSTLDKVFEQACSTKKGETGVIDCSDLSFPDPQVVDPFGEMRAKSSNKRQRNN